MFPIFYSSPILFREKNRVKRKRSTG